MQSNSASQQLRNRHSPHNNGKMRWLHTGTHEQDKILVASFAQRRHLHNHTHVVKKTITNSLISNSNSSQNQVAYFKFERQQLSLVVRVGVHWQLFYCYFTMPQAPRNTRTHTHNVILTYLS